MFLLSIHHGLLVGRQNVILGINATEFVQYPMCVVFGFLQVDTDLYRRL